MPSAEEIDQAILAAATDRWLKVARIIVDALGPRHREAVDSDYNDVAARIEALIEAGKLQCQDNPKRWRHSEVRLPQECDRRHFVATVAIVFPTADRADEFDVWETDILLETEG